MKKLITKILFAVCFLSFVISSSFAARGDINQFYQGQSIDDLIIHFMQANQIPGLSIAIVQAPYIPRMVGYGLSDQDSKRLVATNTVFDIGQITSGFTAVAIMQLVEAGKIKLSDPISHYVNNLLQAWQAITLRELFTHSSGLPNYAIASGFNYSNAYTPDQILEFIKNKPLLFKPSTRVAYSATDYYLLGMVIAKASGMSYQDYIIKNQIDRLHLQHTFFASTLKSVKNEINNGSQPFVHNEFKYEPADINPIEPATGYTEVNGQLVKNKPNNESATYADSGLISNAGDISLWDIGLAGDILIKNAADRDFIYHAITLSNGTKAPANAGWQFPGHPGLMYIEGNIPGFTAYLSRFTAPTELVCVTLLVNKSNVPNLEILGRQIAAAYDAKLTVPVGAAWTVTRQSPYSVNETMDRLEAAIKQQGGQVFARIDHSANANKAGQRLEPMQVLVFGNPSKGTGLIVAKQIMALDLPLRAMVWQDQAGAVWLSFTNPVELAKAYKVQGQGQLLNQMYYALSKAAKQATSAY